MMNQVNNNNDVWGVVVLHLAIAGKALQDTIYKIKSVVDDIKKVWVFIQDSAKTTKASLQAGLIAGFSLLAKLADKVKATIAGLGVVAIVTAAFTFFGVPFQIKDIVDKENIGDTEGVVWGSIGSVMSAADGVSDLGGGITSLAALGAAISAPVLAFFVMVGLPLAIAGLSYAVVKGSYDLMHNGLAFHDINSELDYLTTTNNVDQLKDFIDRTLYDNNDRSVLDPCKVSICERRSDKNVVEVMIKLKTHLDSKADNKVEVAQLALEHMKGYMWRKISTNTIGVFANLAFLATILASLIFPAMSAVVIPAVACGKAALGLTKSGLTLGLQQWNKDWFQHNSIRFQYSEETAKAY
jgi:hypothetical protein